MPDQGQDKNLTPTSLFAFQPSHYDAMAKILSAIYSEHDFDPDGLQAQDEILPAYCKWRRWVVCTGDAAVAFGDYRQTPEMYHPNHFALNIAVHPEYQGRGIGSQLYLHLLAELQELHPITLRTTIRADSLQSVSFLKRRNFVCTMRVIEWWLDLSAVDANASVPKFLKEPEVREPDEEICTLKEGFHIHSVEDLSADPDRNHKLYHLISLLREDVPLPDSATPVDYPQFVTRFLEHPSYIPDAAFVAVAGGEYIGYSDLREAGESNLYGGITGVRREYRRQGVATALKLRGIRYGCVQGYHSIKTFSASENLPIGMINRNCGFIPQYEWMHFEQQCSYHPEEADSDLI